MSETSNATETEDEFPDIETVTDPDLLRLLAGDAQHHLEVASADFKRIVKRLMVLAGSAPNEQQELAERVAELTNHYNLTKAWIDEHPEPERVELVTRDPAGSRADRLGKIIEHLHWRFAGLRAGDIMGGNAAADGGYMPATLETIAIAECGHGSVETLQEDLTVVAIELLGLLWRLEDAGIIRHSETIVEAMSL
jgi:hypothetical protein